MVLLSGVFFFLSPVFFFAVFLCVAVVHFSGWRLVSILLQYFLSKKLLLKLMPVRRLSFRSPLKSGIRFKVVVVVVDFYSGFSFSVCLTRRFCVFVMLSSLTPLNYFCQTIAFIWLIEPTKWVRKRTKTRSLIFCSRLARIPFVR